MKARSISLGSRLPARWKQQPPVSKVCWTMDPPGCRPAGVSENEAVLKEPGHIHSSSQAQTWPPLLCVCVCVCADAHMPACVYSHVCPTQGSMWELSAATNHQLPCMGFLCGGNHSAPEEEEAWQGDA